MQDITENRKTKQEKTVTDPMPTRINHPESIPFPSVAIAGLGLLGGALGLSLKKNMGAKKVLGWARRQESIAEAQRAGAIDHGSTNLNEVLPEADLTVVCLPVNTTISFCQRNAGLWKSGCLVTDVASTKVRVVDEITPVLQEKGIGFLGSHPMAGSEKSGFAAAYPELYNNAAVIITPTPDTPEDWRHALCRFWHLQGARTFCLTPSEHDALTARTSHLPHLLAPALVRTALQKDPRHYATAGSFRDMTRIAAGSPEMWLDIFEHNQQEILAALSEFQNELSVFSEALRHQDWKTLAENLRQCRQMRIDWQEEQQTKGGTKSTTKCLEERRGGHDT